MINIYKLPYPIEYIKTRLMDNGTPYEETHMEKLLGLLDRSEECIEMLGLEPCIETYLPYIRDVSDVLPDKSLNNKDWTVSTLKIHLQELIDLVNIRSLSHDVLNYQYIMELINMYIDIIWDKSITYQIIHDLLRLYYHELRYPNCWLLPSHL